MANTAKSKGKKATQSNHRPGPNGDPGGVVLTSDAAVDLGDVLPDPPSDVVMLDDDDWIEDDS
jgi:hypothetical protein